MINKEILIKTPEIIRGEIKQFKKNIVGKVGVYEQDRKFIELGKSILSLKNNEYENGHTLFKEFANSLNFQKDSQPIVKIEPYHKILWKFMTDQWLLNDIKIDNYKSLEEQLGEVFNYYLHDDYSYKRKILKKLDDIKKAEQVEKINKIVSSNGNYSRSEYLWAYKEISSINPETLTTAESKAKYYFILGKLYKQSGGETKKVQEYYEKSVEIGQNSLPARMAKYEFAKVYGFNYIELLESAAGEDFTMPYLDLILFYNEAIEEITGKIYRWNEIPDLRNKIILYSKKAFDNKSNKVKIDKTTLNFAKSIYNKYSDDLKLIENGIEGKNILDSIKDLHQYLDHRNWNKNELYDRILVLLESVRLNTLNTENKEEFYYYCGLLFDKIYRESNDNSQDKDNAIKFYEKSIEANGQNIYARYAKNNLAIINWNYSYQYVQRLLEEAAGDDYVDPYLNLANSLYEELYERENFYNDVNLSKDKIKSTCKKIIDNKTSNEKNIEEIKEGAKKMLQQLSEWYPGKKNSDNQRAKENREIAEKERRENDENKRWERAQRIRKTQRQGLFIDGINSATQRYIWPIEYYRR
jgi:hypothetical protein